MTIDELVEGEILRDLKIALIEDSEILRKLLAEMLLEIEHVDVAVEAEGEAEAICAMESSQVDLAIIDLELKQGNGLGVVERLHTHPELFGHPKTVVFSNFVVSSMSKRCQSFGVDHIFDKSFQLPELLDLVKAEVSQLHS